MSENTEVAAVQEQELNISERFINKVTSQFIKKAGQTQISEYQKQLIQGYFIKTDRALAMAEENRKRKNDSNSDDKYNNNLPITWANVNLDNLALDVVYYAKVGLNMLEDNHLFAIPYKNTKTNKYDIVLMQGYNGIQYLAEKYAFDKPKSITVELIYSTDTFKPIKKDFNNKVESYVFEINNPFDRGEIVGGFGYIEYEDMAKNKLVFMNKAAIEKRKPKNASPEFWGGVVKVWEKGQKVEVKKDGWVDEMYLKTLKREVYSSKYIPRDPAKIDDSYQYIKNRELENIELEAQQEIDNNTNGDVIDIDIDINNIVDEPEELPSEADNSNNKKNTYEQPIIQELRKEPEQEIKQEPKIVISGPNF